MPTGSKYVSAIANGSVSHNTDEIVLSFYGPRGGNRGIVSLSPINALKLADDIRKAVHETNTDARDKEP